MMPVAKTVLSTVLPAEPSMLIDRGSPPNNLEAPADALLAQPITPSELLFVRDHALVSPRLDPHTYRLTISGTVERATELTLTELKSFEPITLEALMQCAGNGRAFFENTPGNQWERGAVAVAHWRGVRLADLLEFVGIKPEGGFLVFDGSDPAVETGADYRKCVPLAKALHCMLAYEVNGQPLPTQHGFPVRLIVPGWSATYWIKWLRSIVVQAEPCQSFFMANTYRMPGSAQVIGDPLDLENSEAITENNVKSLIAAPNPSSRPVVGLSTPVRGFAWSGGERTITAVDVSTDGGKTWVAADLEARSEPYTWRAWQHRWVPQAAGTYEILARATDSAGNVQPLETPWNSKGYLWNGIDRIPISVN